MPALYASLASRSFPSRTSARPFRSCPRDHLGRSDIHFSASARARSRDVTVPNIVSAAARFDQKAALHESSAMASSYSAIAPATSLLFSAALPRSLRSSAAVQASAAAASDAALRSFLTAASALHSRLCLPAFQSFSWQDSEQYWRDLQPEQLKREGELHVSQTPSVEAMRFPSPERCLFARLSCFAFDRVQFGFGDRIR